MYWIAVSLGFLGSLHCIGMCGPLALGVFNARSEHGGISIWINTALYNFGRILSYVLLGFIFGAFGAVAVLAGIQKYLSVGAGVVLLLMALFTVNPDNFIVKLPLIKDLYHNLFEIFRKYMKKMVKVSFFNFGILNGFLPCGLVYLALAGALSLGNMWGGAGFMLFFGLGTFPAMAFTVLAYDRLPSGFRLSLRRIYPVISFVLGVYLIYRGLYSRLPLELNFFEALNNPVLCH